VLFAPATLPVGSYAKMEEIRAIDLGDVKVLAPGGWHVCVFHRGKLDWKSADLPGHIKAEALIQGIPL
jgi:hypothetical protein